MLLFFYSLSLTLSLSQIRQKLTSILPLPQHATIRPSENDRHKHQIYRAWLSLSLSQKIRQKLTSILPLPQPATIRPSENDRHQIGRARLSLSFSHIEQKLTSILPLPQPATRRPSENDRHQIGGAWLSWKPVSNSEASWCWIAGISPGNKIILCNWGTYLKEYYLDQIFM